MYRPGGVRAPGGRADHDRGRRVSTRSASTPPPLAGGGWEGAAPGPQSALPPTLSRTGRGSVVPALLALLALLPSSASHSPPSPPLLDHAFPPDLRASPRSAPRCSTARAARSHSFRPPAASGAFASDQRRRCSPTCCRRRGSPLLARIPASIRSPWPAPPRSWCARATSCPAARPWRCRPPVCWSRGRAPSAPS